MKEQNGKLSRDEFISFVKAVLKKKSLEENKPLYFEYRVSGNSKLAESARRFDAFAPDGFFRYQEPVIFEFIDSKSKQLEKRIQTIADDYRKNYEAETIFIVNARTSAEELDLTVWDINEINKWIKEYPAEYGHVCSWNIDRKRTTQDKEKFQISENLYRDDLYQKNNDIYTNAIRTCIEEKKGVAIVLGAGVSKEQGAKTWDELLREFQTEIERQHLLDDSEAVFQEVGGTSLTTAQLQSLSKTYTGGKEALKQLSLSLSAGEVFGFLGPNGAGKTTTVKLLTGVLTPSGGSCEILGVNPHTQPEKAHLLSGIVTEHAQMYNNLTGIENLLFYATAFGLKQKEGEQRGELLLRELDLMEAKDRKLATYSTGMRQRLSLARALLHRPKVLFLDEPTSGLDPESAQNVNQMIQNLARKEGVTIFLCTHQLRYAQEICTRYGLIEQGSLLASGTMEELRAQVFTTKTLCVCASAVPDGLNFIKRGANEFEVNIRDKKEIPGLVRKIVEAGEDIYSVNLMEPSLEDIYFALTTGRKEDRGI